MVILKTVGVRVSNVLWTHGKSGIASILQTLVLILGEKMSEIQNIEENVPSDEIISHKGLNFHFYNNSCDQLLIIFFRDYMDSVYVNY